LLGKPKERRPLGRQRRKWDDNIKMGPIKTCWGGGNRMD
jgi:hypothetical protein